MSRTAGGGAKPDPRKIALAHRLNAIMQERGISVAEATRRVRANLPAGSKFKSAHMSNYKNGRSFPRRPYLEALSIALDITEAELRALAPARSPKADPIPATLLPLMIDAGLSPNSDDNGFLSVEDRGGEVRLRFDKRIDWGRALTILKILKENSDTTET